jgi:hypothetical protein
MQVCNAEKSLSANAQPRDVSGDVADGGAVKLDRDEWGHTSRPGGEVVRLIGPN